MKLNLKVAAAVAVAMGLTGGAANASTLAAASENYSQQGQALSGSTAAQALPAITVTLGADYTLNDNIVLAISGATVGGVTNANLTTAANTACSGPDDVVVSFVNRSGNNINLRVTQKNVLNSVGVTCTIQGIEVTAPSLTVVTNVTANWSATTAITNIPFDPSNTLTVASVVDQFTTGSVAALDGVVDVNAPSLRTRFLTDDGANYGTNEDTGSVTATDQQGVVVITGPVATLDGVVVTINGDFGYADTNGNGACTDAFANFIAASAGTAALASNCQSLTITDNAPAAGANPYDVTFTQNVDAVTARIIAAVQTFSGTVRYNYSLGAASGAETDSYAPGAWTLNGFSAFVGYLPYGANVSQIVYLTNKSGLTGEINVSGYNEAGTACNFSAGSITGGTVKSLATSLLSGFEGCYGAGYTGKVSFNVVANFPAALGELYSAYNVGGSDRGTVVNTSNGRLTSGGNSTTGGSL
jgi:hypothetical protein